MSGVRGRLRWPSVLAAVCVVVLLIGGLFVAGGGSLTTQSRSAPPSTTHPASSDTFPALPSEVVTSVPPAGLTDSSGMSTYSFAVIGDIPYGHEQMVSLPGWIDQINAAQPALTFHVGDIKNGSTRCDDEYYSTIRTQFDGFIGPLIYTPGDNEWAECHLPANGGYDPLERLARVRSVYFPHPGTTMGQHPIGVESQAGAGFPENAMLRRGGVDFAVIHLVGANDDLQPWTGLGYDSATRKQVLEEQARMANAISLVKSTFARARKSQDRAVVIVQHVDMFSPSFTPKRATIDSPFTPLVQTFIDEASTFHGPVYLINGDTHHYNSDQPLAAGSRWLDIYGVTGSAENVQRVTVDGSSSSKGWLQVTVNPPGAAATLTWQRIPYTGDAAPP